MRLYNYLPGHLSITVGKFAMGHFLRSGIARLLNFKTISEKAVVPLIWKCSIFIRNHSVKSTNVRHFFDAERILQNYPTSQTYPWDDIINKILETNEKFNINSVVLNTCLNLNLVEACVSYYKYLKTQNNKVTPTEYYLILSVLSKCEDQTESYRDCIQDIFKEIKHLLPINPLLFSCAAKVYYLIEGYWTEMLKIYQENFSESKIEIVESFLVAGAFRHNKPLLGWMLTKENPLIFRKEALVCYIDYCLEMAKNNKFTPLMIDDIVLFYNKTVNTFPYSNLMFKMKELADILNKNKYQNLQWNANECLITKEGYCSHCKLNIGKSVITKDEFESLKSSVLNDIVINKNINLKTSKSEFNRFMLFLQNCSPYSLVIDGLNINNLNSMEKVIKQLIKSITCNNLIFDDKFCFTYFSNEKAKSEINILVSIF